MVHEHSVLTLRDARVVTHSTNFGELFSSIMMSYGFVGLFWGHFLTEFKKNLPGYPGSKKSRLDPPISKKPLAWAFWGKKV